MIQSADVYLFGQVLGTHSFLLKDGFLQPDEYAEIQAQYFLPGGETGTAATETAQAKRNGGEWARQMFRRPIVRELAKGAGILTALFVIWQTGLLIPFALLGGIAAGVVK